MIAEVDRFPIGIMRVLVVDDDPTRLMLLDGLLKKCQYQVTTATQARSALRMLRENQNRFDLIISDVHMPDMDGFKLLELVGLEMDLPVIMLSANSDPKLVMKGITHGACDYLAKPVQLEELRNIWQHVIRKKKVDPKSETVSQNNPRVVWSVDLHTKFITAVNQLGIEKATPKKILDLINVEGLTRENVASHFLKYRLYRKRIIFMQANMAATFEGTDCSYIRMGPIDEFWALKRSGNLPNAALSSVMSLHGLDPSSLTQPVVSSAGLNTSFYHNLEFTWFVVLVFLFQMFITTHN